MNRWEYFRERKAPFATTSFKKRWAYFKGGPISGDEVPRLHVHYIQVVYVMQETGKAHVEN